MWLRPATKTDGEEYYGYVPVYVDDILATLMNPTKILKDMKGKTIKYKNGNIAPPEMYLGARLKRKIMNGNMCWTITSYDYVVAAVQTIKDALKDKRWKLPATTKTPMNQSFVPELDVTEELGPDGIQFFQETIGMIIWATELGRTDIVHEVSLLSQYQASPREGHMGNILHIFAFLDGKPILNMYMNPDITHLEYSLQSDPLEFKEYYRDAKEEMPHNMPSPRGRSVVTTAYLDASHGENKVTRRPHFGYTMFVNIAPVMWMSKLHQTVESSALSSEFIALRQYIEDV